MSIPEPMLFVLKEQEYIVVNLDVEEITKLAKRIAFYSAMIDAAENDPIDDPNLDGEMLDYLRNEHRKTVDTYQFVVNRYL